MWSVGMLSKPGDFPLCGLATHPDPGCAIVTQDSWMTISRALDDGSFTSWLRTPLSPLHVGVLKIIYLWTCNLSLSSWPPTSCGFGSLSQSEPNKFVLVVNQAIKLEVSLPWTDISGLRFHWSGLTFPTSASSRVCIPRTSICWLDCRRQSVCNRLLAQLPTLFVTNSLFFAFLRSN